MTKFRVFIIAWHSIVGVLASAELVSGHLSTLAGPVWGPRIAAGMMLTNVVFGAIEGAIAKAKLAQEAK